MLHSAIAALVQHAATRGELVLARFGDDAVAATVAWNRLRRLTRRYAALRRVDSRFPPHWHLAILGVRPDLQREQVGSRLLADFLERVDAASEPATSRRRELSSWAGMGASASRCASA